MEVRMNITLIGMPGSGKTTIGKALSRDMGLAFLDSDREIVRLHGGTLAEIIARVGQDGFRRIEEDVNANLNVTNAVIAPGGSVVYGPRAMAHLREIGTVVYLQLSYEHVAERLGDLAARGVTFAPGQTLHDLYNERIPLYEQYAQLIAPCDGKNVAEIVAWIRAQLIKRD